MGRVLLQAGKHNILKVFTLFEMYDGGQSDGQRETVTFFVHIFPLVCLLSDKSCGVVLPLIAYKDH